MCCEYVACTHVRTHVSHHTQCVYIHRKKWRVLRRVCVCSPRLFCVRILCRIEHVLYAVHECRTWEEGGELGFGGRMAVHSIGMYAMLVCTLCMRGCPWTLFHCATVWSSVCYVHVHCMLEFSLFVLIPPTRSLWIFGGLSCDLSEVDLFEAGLCHPVPSEFVGNSEGAVQPEGTWTGWCVFVEQNSEYLNLSYMNN